MPTVRHEKLYYLVDPARANRADAPGAPRITPADT